MGQRNVSWIEFGKRCEPGRKTLRQSRFCGGVEEIKRGAEVGLYFLGLTYSYIGM